MSDYAEQHRDFRPLLLSLQPAISAKPDLSASTSALEECQPLDSIHPLSGFISAAAGQNQKVSVARQAHGHEESAARAIASTSAFPGHVAKPEVERSIISGYLSVLEEDTLARQRKQGAALSFPLALQYDNDVDSHPVLECGPQTMKGSLSVAQSILAQGTTKTDFCQALEEVLKQNKALVHRLHERDKEIESLSTDLRKEQDLRSQAEGGLAALLDKLEVILVEKDQLREKLQNAQKSNEAFCKRIIDLDESLIRARERLNASEAASDLERERRFTFEALVQEHVERMVKKNYSLEKEKGALQKANRTLTQRMETLGQEKTCMEREMLKKQDDSKKIQVTCNAIAAEVKAMGKENGDLNASLQILKTNTSAYAVQEVQQVVMKLTKQVTKCKSMVAELACLLEMRVDTLDAQRAAGRSRDSHSIPGMTKCQWTNMFPKKDREPFGNMYSNWD
ncbi:hypothetical protein AcV7_006763 [Taiwanofungus camphoratus]|nr:hypothetical protein AcV7_006763 [Antrodia cinnamomea]